MKPTADEAARSALSTPPEAAGELTAFRLVYRNLRSLAAFLCVIAVLLAANLAFRLLDGVQASWDIVYLGLLAAACLVLSISAVGWFGRLSNKTFTCMESMAFSDGLTGIYNRRYMVLRLEEEIARTRRSGHPLTVLYIDVDRFKTVNDRFGHQGGDELLQEIGTHLKTALRTSDVVGRFGGDEFLVILPDTPVDQAVATAERVFQSARQSLARFNSGPDALPVTLSGGLAQYDDTCRDDDALLSRADGALYDAKRQGGSRVAVHGGKVTAVAMAAVSPA